MPRPTVLRSARALVSAVALLAVLPAHATVAMRASVEELARRSDAVVRGSVTRRTPHRVGARVFTEVRIRPAEVWRGAAPAELTVRVPGGEVGDLGQRVDGAPVFTDGEEVVLFLAADGTGAYRVSGLAQGKFRLEDGVAAPDLSRIDFARSLVRAGERAAEPMPVRELERRVREAR